MSRFLLLATALAFLLCNEVVAHRTFTLSGDRFVRDGVPIQIKAGEIHYSRVPAEYWQDRLLRLRSMGLNAIQTYVPWNYHETRRGHFDFSSPGHDLAHFLGLANKLGLMVVVRAGPYMCGEWEYGGLPAWLLENGTLAIRTYAEPYISHVDAYWQQLLGQQVRPLLYENGGPVVMVQAKNENLMLP